MNIVNYTLSKFKFNQIEMALENGIAIIDSKNQVKIGSLIPVGDWIFKRDVLIEKIIEWRNSNLGCHFSQFPANKENARMYLEGKINPNSPSLLFLIYDLTNGYIGHIAVENIRESNAEVGNFFIQSDAPAEINFLQVLESLTCWLVSELSLKSIYMWFLDDNPNLDLFSGKFKVTNIERSFLTRRNFAIGFQLLLSKLADPQSSKTAVKLELSLPLISIN